MFNGFDMCSCVVTVAVAAQDTAEGTVEAAEILGEAAGVVRNNI